MPAHLAMNPFPPIPHDSPHALAFATATSALRQQTTSRHQRATAKLPSIRTRSLVGGLEHFLFFHILGIIIPIDFHIFQRGGSTTNQVRCQAQYTAEAKAEAEARAKANGITREQVIARAKAKAEAKLKAKAEAKEKAKAEAKVQNTAETKFENKVETKVESNTGKATRHMGWCGWPESANGGFSPEARRLQ